MQSLSVAILAGGSSRRFSGIFKPQVEVCGVPMITRVFESVRPLFTEVLIIVHERGQADVVSRLVNTKDGKTHVVFDVREVTSPLTGLLTAAVYSSNPVFAIVPADTPFVRGETLVKLAERLSPTMDAAVPRWPNGYIEPLVAVYRASVVKSTLSSPSTLENRVSWLLSKINTVYVDVTSISQNPHVEFFNINTLEDLRKAEEICRSTGKVHSGA